GVERVGGGGGGGARQEVEIVVAEDAGDVSAEVARPAQDVERSRAAVDEIADEPELIDVRAEVDQAEQAVQARHAALDIADRVSRHRDLLSHAAGGHTAMRAVTKPARHEPIRTSSAPVPRTGELAHAAWVLPRVPG